MTYVLALVAAIVGGAIGTALGFFVAGALAAVLGITSFEGASGYFAVFIGGPIGCLIGMVAGAVWMLRRRGVQGFGAISGRLGLVAVGVVAAAAAVIGVLYLSQDIVNPNGAAPQLAFEIKLPPGAVTAPGDIQLNTTKNRMPALMHKDYTRNEDGRMVIVGLVEMYYRTSQRLLVVNMPDKTDVLFNVKLPGVPKHSREFSEWRRADYIGEPGASQTRKPTAAESYEIRYRAQWAGED
jgi:hypothetical protein